MMRGRSAMIAAVLVAFTAARAPAADVAFADPSDPMFRALYPRLDPATGLTPVAEPAVASGRGAPRKPHPEGCAPGFRIAEPRVEAWRAAGEGVFVALFLVTPTAPPEVVRPCYHPEPWLCVLEKNKADAWAPVDCAPTPAGLVFPNAIAIDHAAFRLNETETAIGARLRSETATRFVEWSDEALVLFRLHERTLTQVLAVPVVHRETDQTDGATCAHTLVLDVEPTRTAGFFDWRIRTARRAGRGKCAIDPDPTGLYRWDGLRYARSSGIDRR